MQHLLLFLKIKRRVSLWFLCPVYDTKISYKVWQRNDKKSHDDKTETYKLESFPLKRNFIPCIIFSVLRIFSTLFKGADWFHRIRHVATYNFLFVDNLQESKEIQCKYIFTELISFTPENFLSIYNECFFRLCYENGEEIYLNW